MATMSAQNSHAYFTSAALHALVAGALVFFAYEFSKDTREDTKTIELVAGDGTNFGATVAPAKGSAMAGDVPLPNFSRQVRNKIANAERRAVNEVAKERAAEEKAAAAAAAAEKKNQQVSYDEWVKTHPGQPPPKTLPPNYKPLDTKGIAGGVDGGSTANTTGGAHGKALVSQGAEGMDGYFALLKNMLKENHEPPAGVSDRLSARVEFYLGADGSISRVRIIRSSGNAEFDQSVKDAFARTRSVGIPRPDKRGSLHEIEFRMRDDD